MELQAVEKEVWEELWDVMKQERRTQWRVEKTQKDVKTTKRKVEKIEEIIEDEMSGRKPRWKVRKKK